MGRNVLERESKFANFFHSFADCNSPPFHPTTLVNGDGLLPSHWKLLHADHYFPSSARLPTTDGGPSPSIFFQS